MKTVLVADGDNGIRNIVRLLFTEKMGYRVVAVSKGTDAVFKAKELIPDIVLADAYLSDKDGYQVAREIKSDPFLRTTHVVLLNSAFATLNKKKALKARVDGVIIKPFGPEIVEKVGSLLDHNETRGIKFIPIIHAWEMSKRYAAKLATVHVRVGEGAKSTHTKSFAVMVQPIVLNVKDTYRLASAFAENVKGTILRNRKAVTKSLRLPSVQIPMGKYAAEFKMIYNTLVSETKHDYSKSFKSIAQTATKSLKYYSQPARQLTVDFKTTMGKLKHLKTPTRMLKIKSFSFPSAEVLRRKYVAKFEILFKQPVEQKKHAYSESFKITSRSVAISLTDYCQAARGLTDNFRLAMGKLREMKISPQILTARYLETSLVPLFFTRGSLISVIGMGVILLITTLIPSNSKNLGGTSSFFNSSMSATQLAERESDPNLEGQFYDGADDKKLEEKELSEVPIKQDTKLSRQKHRSHGKSRVAKNEEDYSLKPERRGNNRKGKIRHKSGYKYRPQKDLEEVLKGAFLLQ